MKKEKILKILISILLINLPFLDMLRTTNFKNIEVFNLALIELINIVLIGISFILTFFKIEKKKFIKIFVYFVILGIYIYLHYKNILMFDKNIFQKANPNFLIETFYIIRVYLMPIVLMFILGENKDIFNKEYYFKIIKVIVSIICLSILVLNILKLSYISYSETKEFVKYNIFDYFKCHSNYKLLTSRGWFDSANEISAILFMIFPINIYLFFKEQKKYNIFLLIIQGITMILLGTKTAAFGSIIITAFILIYYIITAKLKYDNFHDKIFLKYIVCFIILCFYICISPFMLSRKEEKYDYSVKDKTAYEVLKGDIKEEDIYQIFEKYHEEYMIKDVYLEEYPLKNDYTFWLNMAKRDKALNGNNRIMKTSILNRIEERNNNKSDKWLGLGYTSNLIDPERDYVYQYYLFGIIGLILLIGPYFYLFGLNAFMALKNIKNSINLKTICTMMPPVLCFMIAYMSGHVFNCITPMYYLVVVLALSNCIERDKNESKCNSTSL